MLYDQLSSWVRDHNLIMNRVKCINDVTNDLARVTTRKGTYSLKFLGREIATWRAYDDDACRQALAVADALLDVLWDCRREGYATFV